MMVTVSLGALILILAGSTVACGCIGLWAGLRIGYLKGFIDSMNYDAIRGLGRAASQGQEGGKA